MRRAAAIAALALALAAAVSAEAQTAYLSSAEDIPLPPGWTERATAVFEGIDGRLIEAQAAGASADLGAFYRAALPALGWSESPGEELMFRRGRERLTITPHEGGARFTITATPAPSALD